MCVLYCYQPYLVIVIFDQVNAGVQEYANAFLKDTEALLLPEDEVERLKDVYRSV